MAMQPKFRTAERKDIPLVMDFIKGIAVYEKMLNEVVATEELLDYWMFQKGLIEVFFIMEDGKEVGFALYFHNFSTFVGRAGLYVEDVFIWPEYRHKGYGKAAFKHLAEIAVERGCGRMEWVCLDWNRPSIDFYTSMGAHPMDGWHTYRLTKEQIEKLAAE